MLLHIPTAIALALELAISLFIDGFVPTRLISHPPAALGPLTFDSVPWREDILNDDTERGLEALIIFSGSVTRELPGI